MGGKSHYCDYHNLSSKGYFKLLLKNETWPIRNQLKVTGRKICLFLVFYCVLAKHSFTVFLCKKKSRSSSFSLA